MIQSAELTAGKIQAVEIASPGFAVAPDRFALRFCGSLRLRAVGDRFGEILIRQASFPLKTRNPGKKFTADGVAMTSAPEAPIVRVDGTGVGEIMKVSPSPAEKTAALGAP